MRTLALLLTLFLWSPLVAQEIQLTHQVIASSPIDGDGYSWTVLVDGSSKPIDDSDKKTIIVTLHGESKVVLVLSVVSGGELKTFVSETKPGPKPGPDVVDPPIVKPEGVDSIMIVYESANQSPTLQKLFVTIRTTFKQYPVQIVDQDSTNPNLKTQIEAAKKLGLPAIVSLDDDGEIISTVSLPETYTAFVEAIK